MKCFNIFCAEHDSDSLQHCIRQGEIKYCQFRKRYNRISNCMHQSINTHQHNDATCMWYKEHDDYYERRQMKNK